MKEPLTNQQNDTADQLLYVVAGGGVVRVRDQSYKADPDGWFMRDSARRATQHPARRAQSADRLSVAMGDAASDQPVAR